MSTVITYYSYKGGVGRSMSLANTAVVLSKWGYKVLIVDWDLEAPGLEHFFKGFINIDIVKEKIGVIDLLHASSGLHWQDALIPISLESAEPIHLILSGKRDDDYFKKVRAFDIDDFYAHGGGAYIERLRNEWKQQYDFILIDSRTGVTEIGGICAVQLPDIVVLLFTATDQGFEGILNIADRALRAQQSLPYDRQKLVFIPILTRFDTQAEFKLSQRWVDLFAEKLKGIYDDWLPLSIKRNDFLQTTRIPYMTYFSFGEKLPVLEQSSFDSSGLTYSYENLAALIANKLTDVELLVHSRDRFVSQARKGFSGPMIEQVSRENNKKINIFVSYARKDERLKSELLSHISVLSKLHNVSVWSDDNILPGDEWDNVIKKNLVNADVVLLLISPDYLTSKFTQYELETSVSMNKRIIPIIVRNTNLANTAIAKYYALPRNMEAIETASNRDQVFSEVIGELEKLVVNMKGRQY